jgi:hypothetical protein
MQAENVQPAIRTREDVRQYMEALCEQRRLQDQRLRVLQSVRRISLLAVLCFSILEYYFVAVHVEILSLPELVLVAPHTAPIWRLPVLTQRN